ncbi:dystroglycan-like [Pollicipes pollicipes]|uniref:dystroglycan-like n=1 Tax=Pollicipes pollicipes TaxID=41117 RepID=UPI0018853AD0|nr:dystroglycan-like [Pollicipes pollicipes]
MVDVVLESDSGHAGAPLDWDEDSGELSCADGSASTVVALYFDVAPQTLDGAARLRMLRALAAAVHVEPEVMHVTSHSGAMPLEDESVLEAGAGSHTRQSRQLTVFSWKVGCSEQVHPNRRRSVQAVQADLRMERLAAAADRPAVGWLMYARQPTGRHRRQVDGSGDFGDDDYDYNYDDNYDYGDPVTHVVPPLASPTFSGPPASPAYPPPRVTASAVWPRVSTPIPVAAVPTRYYPDSLQPSRTDDGPLWPPARETSGLESSMNAPGGRVEATARLPGGVLVTPSVPLPPGEETISVGARNFRPLLQRRMRKLLLVAGKEFRLRVPEETFQDLESGGTRQLHLSLKKTSGQELDDSDWIQFDAAKQEIYGLPKEEHIGEYQFELTAMDAEGASASDQLAVAVRLYQQWRAINHRFHLQLKMLRPRDFPVTVDWELLLLRKLADMFGQTSTSSLLVYDVRAMLGGSVRIAWVNDTISTHRCDQLALSRIASHLVGKNGEPTAELRKVLAPEFGAQRVRLELLNVCHGVLLTSVPTPATEEPDQNVPPIRRQPVDRITASVGRLLKQQVPADAFFDMEDGNAREMELRLLTSERQLVPRESWLRFEPKNQEFIGLPLDKDVGRSHYHLECIDSGGLTVSDSIEVVVQPRDDAKQHTVEFGVTLDNDFRKFSRDPMQKKRLMEKLAELLGDGDTDAMLVHDIREGSVVFSWFNESLPTDECADADIHALREALLDDAQQVTPRAVQALGPDFRLTAAEVTPRGICLARRTPTTAAAPPAAAPGPLDEQAPESKGDEYLVTFIIPAVVIAAMLLIAGLVACVLYRARRRGKMTMTDNGTYVSRGIPVIFSDELEDRMEKSAKTPVILTHERPPEPPTYPADGAPSPATPMLDEHGEAAGGGGEDTPYERPPPLAGAEAGRGGRAKPVPNYRQPPPYVPP